MENIRTKPQKSAPKVLDTAARLPQHTKNALENVRDKAKEIDARDHGTPENYATDQISGKASDAAQKTVHETANRSKQVVNRGRQEISKRFQQNASRAGLNPSSRA